MNLTDARTKMAAVLAPVADGDPNVLTSLVDAIEPPALMLGWGEPWLEPQTACFATGALVVTAVAARLSPGEGLAKLEDLIAYVLGRTRADSGTNWPLHNVSGPRVFLIAKTNYLAVRITFHVPLEVL